MLVKLRGITLIRQVKEKWLRAGHYGKGSLQTTRDISTIRDYQKYPQAISLVH